MKRYLLLSALFVMFGLSNVANSSNQKESITGKTVRMNQGATSPEIKSLIEQFKDRDDLLELAESFLLAVTSEDYDLSYELLSPETKANYSKSQFIQTNRYLRSSFGAIQKYEFKYIGLNTVRHPQSGDNIYLPIYLYSASSSDRQLVISIDFDLSANPPTILGYRFIPKDSMEYQGSRKYETDEKSQ